MIRRLAQRWADAQLRRHNELLHDRWIRGQQRNRFLTDQLEVRERSLKTVRELYQVQRTISADRRARIEELEAEIKSFREAQ